MQKDSFASLPFTEYYFSSRHECGITTGGCSGMNSSTESCFSTSGSVCFWFCVAQQDIATPDISNALTDVTIVCFVLLCISPRFFDYYWWCKRLEVLWSLDTIRHAACCCCLAVLCIPLNKLLVVVLPAVTVCQLVDTVVNGLARWSIEAACVVAHNRILGRTPNASPIC